MHYNITSKQLAEEVKSILMQEHSKNLNEATYEDIYKATAYCVRRMLSKKNGIIECFLPLDDYIDTSAQQNCEDLAYESLWDSIKSVIEYYADNIFPMADASRFFVCITICGCKGVVTEFRSARYFGDNGAIGKYSI